MSSIFTMIFPVHSSFAGLINACIYEIREVVGGLGCSVLLVYPFSIPQIKSKNYWTANLEVLNELVYYLLQITALGVSSLTHAKATPKDASICGTTRFKGGYSKRLVSDRLRYTESLWYAAVGWTPAIQPDVVLGLLWLSLISCACNERRGSAQNPSTVEILHSCTVQDRHT
jgi:hypothetical protein